ncbi:hypothetical protein ACHQM5_013096 [Ranunculus cassubicifolius]
MVYWLLSSFVSATMQVLLEKLADYLFKANGSVSDVNKKLEKLKRTLIRVQSLIHDGEKQQVSDMAWQVLLQDIERVAYDADDLFDEITVKVSEFEEGYHKQDLVRKLLLSLFKTTSVPNMSEIQASFDEMLREIDSLCLTQLAKGRYLDMIVSKVQTSSLTDERVFGREIDEVKIRNMVISSEESSRGYTFAIIPIVGMIGVGKTMVAQLVYNYDYQGTMSYPFDIKMWVSVSQEFDVVKLTRAIIEVANRESTSHLLKLESLQVKLKEILQEKKFLLVLDDMLNEKQNEWDLLLRPMKYGLKGSKIIVTTRNHGVSSLIGTSEPYYLKCLSDQDCWSLIREEALEGIQAVPKLEEIGMLIATKCKGLPLAAKIVGRLLRSTVDENVWTSVSEKNIWDLSVVKNEIVPALTAGDLRFPPYVRQCFAYCSMFPQSYDFDKKKIVQMWMGEGFVTPDSERKRVEDMGGYYFDQLLWKSFFQKDGQKYKIHDAVHSSIQSVVGDKFFRMENSEGLHFDKSMRHMSLVCENIQKPAFEACFKCKGLRTLLLLPENGSPFKEIHPALFFELRRLRVLDMSSTRIEELTPSVGNLKHLRFLDLSNTLLKWLPETMHELRVLQTLRLTNCAKLISLPRSTGKLKSLIHLELGGDTKLTSMPSGIGNLIGLETIGEFVVGPDSGQLKELKHMNNIRGSLCIRQLENVSSPQEATEANLANKKYLDKLELQWSSVLHPRNGEHLLYMIRPHESLKELTLRRYGGRLFPSWLCNSFFTRLTSICLYECENCGLLPSLGKLPKLKHLKIDGMHELVMVDELFMGGVTGFQSLETLEFCDMPKLESWVGVGEGDMSSLRELIMVECLQLIILPSLHYLQSLEKVELQKCPRLPSLPREGLSSSVESLIIMECSLLTERCKKDGVDWTKIEHIPYIEMDFQKVQDLKAMR